MNFFENVSVNNDHSTPRVRQKKRWRIVDTTHHGFSTDADFLLWWISSPSHSLFSINCRRSLSTVSVCVLARSWLASWASVFPARGQISILYPCLKLLYFVGNTSRLWLRFIMAFKDVDNFWLKDRGTSRVLALRHCAPKHPLFVYRS
jgi:hypothetical protein